MNSNLRVRGSICKNITEEVLTVEALKFLEHLHNKFDHRRKALLEKRKGRQANFDCGEIPNFLQETKKVREQTWQVVEAPHDLLDRRVEITGPTDRKMMIHGLNSGASVFMADLEDSLSPRWQNILEGHHNLNMAVRGEIDFTSPQGKSYKLQANHATLVVRPRGWHLEERHIQVGGSPMSASLFDFGLYFFHNSALLLSKKSGPYFYLPKLESHEEARLWNDVFVEAQDYLTIPQKSIRATVLIETILAAFEMEEILYELRDHAAGLNAGRWDYIFSFIKRFRKNPGFVMPNRSQVTMSAPLMRAYSQHLVHVCHKRGAHAIGGMSAFIPNRKDPKVTQRAIEQVQVDKKREAQDGFDGTWVAHPDLVSVAKEVFAPFLVNRSHQKHKLREDVKVGPEDLLSSKIDGGFISEEGVRSNINVAIQYMERWMSGLGAVAIHNLMEDAATAEISRAQLWQWLHHKVVLDNGQSMTQKFYQNIRTEELTKLEQQGSGGFRDAANLLDKLVLNDTFEEFLTVTGYDDLNHSTLQQ